jgi:signal peptidase I
MLKVAGIRISPRLKPWLGFVWRILFLLIVFWLFFGVIFGLNRMSGVAMDPSIKDGELMMFLRVGGDFGVNDVVLYEHDGKTEISRIVALPDQIVDVNRDGYLTVDGVVESKSAIVDVDSVSNDGASIFPMRVPSGTFFMLNDNYDYGEDSRNFGAIDNSSIRGRIVTTLKVRDI